MSKSTYFNKIITVESDKYPSIRAVRSRNTDGYACIELYIGTNSIQLSNDSDDFGDEYEQIALEAVDILRTVAEDPCSLPKNAFED